MPTPEKSSMARPLCKITRAHPEMYQVFVFFCAKLNNAGVLGSSLPSKSLAGLLGFSACCAFLVIVSWASFCLVSARVYSELDVCIFSRAIPHMGYCVCGGNPDSKG